MQIYYDTFDIRLYNRELRYRRRAAILGRFQNLDQKQDEENKEFFDSGNMHANKARPSTICVTNCSLFCKRALSKRRYSAIETYDFKEPINRVTNSLGWVACVLRSSTSLPFPLHFFFPRVEALTTVERGA